MVFLKTLKNTFYTVLPVATSNVCDLNPNIEKLR